MRPFVRVHPVPRQRQADDRYRRRRLCIVLQLFQQGARFGVRAMILHRDMKTRFGSVGAQNQPLQLMRQPMPYCLQFGAVKSESHAFLQQIGLPEPDIKGAILGRDCTNPAGNFVCRRRGEMAEQGDMSRPRAGRHRKMGAAHFIKISLRCRTHRSIKDDGCGTSGPNGRGYTRPTGCERERTRRTEEMSAIHGDALSR